MAPQRATLYTYGNDELCAEMQKFIEDAGILLTVRDIGKQPFTPAEFYELVGNLSLEHFINPASTLHPANGDSEDGLNRRQLLDKVSEDPTVLRRPILKTSRLVTVGADRKRIAEALQLNNNGTPRELQNPPQPSNHHRRARN
jgi:arsenate reductase-like glutaredoxin family protein